MKLTELTYLSLMYHFIEIYPNHNIIFLFRNGPSSFFHLRIYRFHLRICDLNFVRPEKKLKILNLARNGKIVILSKWDVLKPVICLDLG